MRLTGALLLVLAGFLWGLGRLSRLRRDVSRRAGLGQLCRGLGYELGRFRRPLPETFSALAGGLEGEAKALCAAVAEGFSQSGRERFSVLWERNISGLPPEERAVLLPLGTVLGRYGAEEQTEALEQCQKALSALENQSRERLQSRGRVSVGLGTAMGLLAAVLFI